METKNKQSKGSVLFIIIAIIIVLAFLGNCSSCCTSSSKSKSCKVCHKTFTNKDDVNSIAWTNMCEKCYNNYKYTQAISEGLKKYAENN